MMRRHSLFAMADSCYFAIAVSAVCLPTASHGQTQFVQPVDWTRFADTMGVRAGDTFGQTLVTVLQNEARYELNWVDTDQQVVNNLPGWNGVDCYYPRFSDYGYENAVRPLTGFTYSMAAMLQTGIYSPSVGGLSSAAALRRVELAIRGAVFTHVANTPSGYTGYQWGQGSGGAWEGAYWGAQVAQAAWWLWGDLSNETKLAVAKMVEHDANALIGRTVPYWTNKDGTVVSPGDTKAEENAWNSELLAVAQAMMPNHPSAPQWRHKASEYQVTYYPQGTDWTTKVTDMQLNTDLNAEHFGLDAGKSFDAMRWAGARVLALRALQTRSGHDGNIYQSGDWKPAYRGQDEVIFQSNGQAWMQWWLMQNNAMSPIRDHWGAVPEPCCEAQSPLYSIKPYQPIPAFCQSGF